MLYGICSPQHAWPRHRKFPGKSTVPSPVSEMIGICMRKHVAKQSRVVKNMWQWNSRCTIVLAWIDPHHRRREREEPDASLHSSQGS